MKLTIEKMVYGGDGLAHLPPDASGRGKTAFVPFVLPAEEVEASVIEEKPGHRPSALADDFHAPVVEQTACPAKRA